jgi:hypothetical protein
MTLRVLIRATNPGIRPNKEEIRLLKARLANAGASRAENIRISNRAVEIDFFPEDEVHIPKDREIVEMLVGNVITVRNLTQLRGLPPRDDDLIQALKFYDEERFWEAHEALEGIWRTLRPGSEKDVLQSIILICAAYVHDQRGDEGVSKGILQRALKKLDAAGIKSYRGIDLVGVRGMLKRAVDRGSTEVIPIQSSGVRT